MLIRGPVTFAQFLPSLTRTVLLWIVLVSAPAWSAAADESFEHSSTEQGCCGIAADLPLACGPAASDCAALCAASHEQFRPDVVAPGAAALELFASGSRWVMYVLAPSPALDFAAFPTSGVAPYLRFLRLLL